MDVEGAYVKCPHMSKLEIMSIKKPMLLYFLYMYIGGRQQIFAAS
jgi:hypothetical protein